MFISIIIPNHGRNDLLNKCIQKIRESAYGDYEIIVVDDASIPPVTVEDQNVKLIVSENNIGPAGARNLGAKGARGEIFLFIDSDVMLSKGAYQELLETFKTTDFDAVQGMFSIDFRYNDFCSNYKNLYWNFNQMLLNPKSYSICTAIFSIRKDVFNEIGGFNSAILVGEDKAIGLELEERKKKVFRNKQIQGIHCKKFSFLQLLKHHLQNSVAATLVLLRTKRRHPSQDRAAWAGKGQIIGIILAPIIVFLTLLALFTFNPVFLLLDIVALMIFLYITTDFLRYIYRRFGLKFSFFAFFMFLLEEVVAAIGICLGVLRFFFSRRKDLDFKLGRSI